MKVLKLLFFAVLALGLVACSTKEQVSDVLENNPDIIIKALEKEPEKFLDFLEDLTKKARELHAKRQEKKQHEELEKAMEKPLEPNITEEDEIFGSKDAPITLVEYSDFQCPFCTRGYSTVQELKKEYGDKLRFVYKHLPLDFHKQAMLAAKYFEAAMEQSPEKAWKMHDNFYENQEKLKQGDKYFRKVAKDLGLNMKKLANDLNSEKIEKEIQEDMQEARKFGFSGTPGFLINGVPVRGAYPKDHFVTIINKLKETGKLDL